MDFESVIGSIGTSSALKRFASAYVIDFRALTEDEVRAALLKTAPQYYHQKNVEKAIEECFYSTDRSVRTIAPIFLKTVLLNQDEFLSPPRETDDKVIEWEQNIIDSSNEEFLKNAGEKLESLKLFQFVVETAWQNNQDVSVDEKHLIDKLKSRLNVTDREYRMIEAALGKFPKPGNEVHTYGEIDQVRKALQSLGLLATIRDNGKTDFDVIPEEIARVLRVVFNTEIRTHGYRELVGSKYVRNKKYLSEVLKKCDVLHSQYATLDELKEMVVEQVNPSVVLGGTSPRDGLATDDLKKWCGDLGLNVSGQKRELIESIIRFYDQLAKKEEVAEDPRSVWYTYFEKFAARDLGFLKSQQLINKDLEAERRFEEATDFLFETRLGHKPLKMHGTEHPDGILSFRDSLIMWDNKSKESAVKLKQHESQILRYISHSEKTVAGFIVIGPDFSDDSPRTAQDIFARHGVIVCLITAEELKLTAEAWTAKENADDAAFPLGYLLQMGRFNRANVPI